MSIRPDYCPVGNVPCQSLCEEPCTTRSSRLADEALMRQALDVLEGSEPEYQSTRSMASYNAAIAALRARLEKSNV